MQALCVKQNYLKGSHKLSEIASDEEIVINFHLTLVTIILQ